MKQVFVVQIKSGNNNGQFLGKYSKGYITSKDINLQNLFHSKDAAEKNAQRYIQDVEDDIKHLSLGWYKDDKELLAFVKLQALRGKEYIIVTYDLVKKIPRVDPSLL